MSIATMSGPDLQGTLGLQDNPYTDRVSLIKTVSDKMNGQEKYTFSGYVDAMEEYGDKKRYLQVAQYTGEGQNTNFSLLGPRTSVQSGQMILEISKRNADGTLPQTQEEADKLDPSMVVNYSGKMYIIPLNQAIDGKDRHNILEKNYNAIAAALKELGPDGLKDNKVVADTVIQTLQKNNSLKVPLQKSLAPIAGRRRKLLQLFGLGKKSDGTIDIQKPLLN